MSTTAKNKVDITPARLYTLPADPMRHHYIGELIKHTVRTAMFCPVSGQALDVRTCVTVLTDGENDDVNVHAVLSPEGYATMREEFEKIETVLFVQGTD